MRLADALQIPLRERNVILIAAGYAPVFRETELGSAQMMQAKRAVEFILKQQEPYPAIVLDRHWNLVDANEGARHLLQFLIGGPPAERNIVRHIFSHQILRPYIANWEATAGDLIHRLHQEIAWDPTDEFLRSLLNEVLSYPDVPQPWQTRNLDAALSPVLTFNLRKGGTELRFLSTWTTFGTPQDVTLEELKIESSFPADDETAKTWHDLVATQRCT